jgi:hypothetical protein
MSGNSKKVLVHKFRKIFRNSICEILKQHKHSLDHIIYEEDSFDSETSMEDEEKVIGGDN